MGKSMSSWVLPNLSSFLCLVTFQPNFLLLNAIKTTRAFILMTLNKMTFYAVTSTDTFLQLFLNNHGSDRVNPFSCCHSNFLLQSVAETMSEIETTVKTMTFQKKQERSLTNGTFNRFSITIDKWPLWLQHNNNTRPPKFLSLWTDEETPPWMDTLCKQYWNLLSCMRQGCPKKGRCLQE